MFCKLVEVVDVGRIFYCLCQLQQFVLLPLSVWICFPLGQALHQQIISCVCNCSFVLLYFCFNWNHLYGIGTPKLFGSWVLLPFLVFFILIFFYLSSDDLQCGIWPSWSCLCLSCFILFALHCVRDRITSAQYVQLIDFHLGLEIL